MPSVVIDALVGNRQEQRCIGRCAVPSHMNTFGACWMQQHIVQFVALAVNSQMQYATPIVNVEDF